MAERNAAAVAEMEARFGVTVSALDPAELRERGRPVRDRVADTLGLQDLLARVRAAGR